MQQLLIDDRARALKHGARHGRNAR